MGSPHSLHFSGSLPWLWCEQLLYPQVQDGQAPEPLGVLDVVFHPRPPPHPGPGMYLSSDHRTAWSCLKNPGLGVQTPAFHAQPQPSSVGITTLICKVGEPS